ncbi:MAG TPA: hypothetical protein VGO56_08770 [Pyrinomonadaceae bacterium]|jgi:hypothetical protein|nr:hypothetical protein [Pyrinomonadaceae bacterium]
MLYLYRLVNVALKIYLKGYAALARGTRYDYALAIPKWIVLFAVVVIKEDSLLDLIDAFTIEDRAKDLVRDQVGETMKGFLSLRVERANTSQLLLLVKRLQA